MVHIKTVVQCRESITSFPVSLFPVTSGHVPPVSTAEIHPDDETTQGRTPSPTPPPPFLVGPSFLIVRRVSGPRPRTHHHQPP